MRPIKNLDELADAAFQAGHLILSGAITRQVASDDLWGIAMASGFVDRYGEDAVQAHIAVSLPPNDETGEMTITCEDPHVVNAQQRTIEDELDARAPTQTSTLPQVRAITLDKFLEMDIPPRSTMLTPWLQNQGLAMIYAPRGTGKTRVAHGVCHAIATGSGFLRWTAPQPKRVLLLDGEMPAAVLQEMLRATVQASQSAMADSTYFNIAAADLFRDGLPDLSSGGSGVLSGRDCRC